MTLIKWGMGALLVLIIVLIVIWAILYEAVNAEAHDYTRPDLAPWFMSLTNRHKMACCDGTDAQHIADPDWESVNGHYRVRLEGEWVDVPDEAVVDGPNKAEQALVWPYHLNGHPAVRCFMPGTQV